MKAYAILLECRGLLVAGAELKFVPVRLLAGRSGFAVHGQMYADAGREAEPVRWIDTSCRQLS